MLSARDWHPVQGRVPWRQVWIDDPAYDANGFWMIDVFESGRYEIELRAYPREADSPAGANHARLQIGDTVFEQELDDGADFATFSLRLTAGETRLQTWLTNDRQRRERGAYYVYVTCLHE